MSKNEARITTIVGGAITLMFVAAIFDEFSTRKLSIVFFFVFWAPLLVIHELGHAFMARALGWHVREIVIGFGRTVWQRQIGETRLVVKLAPMEGYVLPVPSDRDRMRMKSALIYAAGPGAELLILAAAVAALGWDTVFNDADDIALVALESLAVVILVGAGFNLLPFRTDGAVSDGLGIISSPFMSDEEIELRLMTFETRELGRLLDAGDTQQAVALSKTIGEKFPDNRWLNQLRINALSEDGQTDAARGLIRTELANVEEPGTLQKELLKMQAQIELDAGDPDYLTLDLAIQKAMAIDANAPGLMAIKGASLIRRGKHEDGGNMLAHAWRSNDGSADDAMMLAWLSIAARGVRNEDAWHHFRESFEATNRSAPLRRRLEPLL
jgi:hypothetical protein